jgi:hypothetical protein
MRILSIAVFFLFAAPVLAQESEEIFEIDPLTIDVSDLLHCAVDVPTYNTFALSLDDKKYGHRARGWSKVDSKNPFLAEYRLPQAMDVVGGVTETYRTSTIVFSSSAIMAVIDLKDPTELAQSMQMDDFVSLPGKFIGQKTVSENTVDDTDLNMRFKSKIARSISTVSSHPGKTLFGCSYRIDMEDLPKTK